MRVLLLLTCVLFIVIQENFRPIEAGPRRERQGRLGKNGRHHFTNPEGPKMPNRFGPANFRNIMNKIRAHMKTAKEMAKKNKKLKEIQPTTGPEKINEEKPKMATGKPPITNRPNKADKRKNQRKNVGRHQWDTNPEGPKMPNRFGPANFRNIMNKIKAHMKTAETAKKPQIPQLKQVQPTIGRPEKKNEEMPKMAATIADTVTSTVEPGKSNKMTTLPQITFKKSKKLRKLSKKVAKMNKLRERMENGKFLAKRLKKLKKRIGRMTIRVAKLERKETRKAMKKLKKE